MHKSPTSKSQQSLNDSHAGINDALVFLAIMAAVPVSIIVFKGARDFVIGFRWGLKNYKKFEADINK